MITKCKFLVEEIKIYIPTYLNIITDIDTSGASSSDCGGYEELFVRTFIYSSFYVTYLSKAVFFDIVGKSFTCNLFR